MDEITENRAQRNSDDFWKQQNELCDIVFQEMEQVDDESIEELLVISTNKKDELNEPENESHNVQVISVGRWPFDAINKLVVHRLKIEDLFKSPKHRKSKLWEMIAKQLNDSDFSFTPEECSSKFKHLQETYKKIAVKRNLSKTKELHWRWFEIFDRVYHYKPSQEKPPDYLLGSTLETTPHRRYHRENLSTTLKRTKEKSEQPEEEVHGEIEEKKWLRPAVKMMLELRAQMNQSFNVSKVSRHLLWSKIAKKLNQLGYDVSSKECAVKFRNLLGTYRKNVARKQFNNAEIVWEWFKLMQQIKESESSSYENEETVEVEETGAVDEADGLSEINESVEEAPDYQHETTKSYSNDDSYDFEPKKMRLDECDEKNSSSENEASFNDPLDFLLSNNDSVKQYDQSTESMMQSYWEKKLQLNKTIERRKWYELRQKNSIEKEKIQIERAKLTVLERLTCALEKLSQSSFFHNY